MMRPSWVRPRTPFKATPETAREEPKEKLKPEGSRHARKAGTTASQQVVRTCRGTVAQQPYRIGSAAGLDRVELDEGAIAEIQELKAAKGTLEARHARVRWWTTRCAARKLAPGPITTEKLRLAAALLRRGGYRSAPAYLYAVKRASVTPGHSWTDGLQVELSDAVRATTRGLGPAAQAEPFDMNMVAKLAEDDARTDVGGDGPEHPRDAVLVASWWLLREIELSTATVGQTSFSGPCGQEAPRASATILLPVSKSDPTALGRRRALGCSCPSPACPVAALRRLVSGRASTAPLLATRSGAPCEKAAVSGAFRAVAKACGHPNPEGVTAHSGRSTGAQTFARAGVPTGRIAAFGRWDSKAVFRYIRDADCVVTGEAIATDVSAALGGNRAKKRTRQAESDKADGRRQVKGEEAESRRQQRARIFDGVRKILKRARPKPEPTPTALLQFFRTARGGVAHLRRDSSSAWCGKAFDAECEEWAEHPEHLPPCKPCRRQVGRR